MNFMDSTTAVLEANRPRTSQLNAIKCVIFSFCEKEHQREMALSRGSVFIPTHRIPTEQAVTQGRTQEGEVGGKMQNKIPGWSRDEEEIGNALRCT